MAIARRIHRALLASGLTLACLAPAGRAQESGSAAVPLDLPREPLNSGLPGLANPPDLETPQASLANFIRSCERGDYARAAHSLNLNGIGAPRQAAAGPGLARQLKAVMDGHVWFRWSDVPDRPDGQRDGDGESKGEMVAADKAQTNFRLYSLFVGDRDYEIRLQRLGPPGGPPRWVFSRQTVEQIPDLFAQFGPSRLEEMLPSGLRTHKFLKVAAWQWIGFTAILLAGSLQGSLLQKGLGLALGHVGPGWPSAILGAFRGPGALAVGLWTFYFLTRSYLALAGPIAGILEPLYIAVGVACLVWFLQRFIRGISAQVSLPYHSHNSDEANALLTRIEVARNLVTFLVVMVGTAFALSRFEWFRQVGTTLLASAGVAGLVLGIAAQRVLGNLFAGLLLAVTQPVKSGDAILFEGDFGWIEEIAPTYLVIRSWDLRRVVVPIAYFLDKPFQNWSRRSQQLMLPVYVHADHRVDVELVRREFQAIMEESSEWDRAVPPILQVTGANEHSLELRALCSAADPTSSWNLQCRVREKLTAFLRDHESGRFLPRTRVALAGDDRQPPPA